jgi:hypothetical protein
MRGVGVAVEELDPALRRRARDLPVDIIADHDAAHRHGAVGEALGHCDEIRHDPEGLCREGLSGAAEAGDHLVEDQQDPVPVADLAESLQVPPGRDQDSGRAGDRLDEARRDGVAPVEFGEALEILSEIFAMLALPRREAVLLEPGVAHVRDSRQAGAEALAVLHHPAQRDAADVDPVVAALAAHEALALPLTAGAVVEQSDLHGGVDRLGAGIRKEDAVQVAGCDVAQHARQLEGAGMAVLEGRPEIERPVLARDGVDDLGAAVAEGAAEQARTAVQQPVPAIVPEVHSLGPHQQPGILLEEPVRGERYPVVIEIRHCVRPVVLCWFLEHPLRRWCQRAPASIPIAAPPARRRSAAAKPSLTVSRIQFTK